MYLNPCEAPFSLDDLATRIRKSSNFRFAWQFYHCSGIDPQSPPAIRRTLETIIATPELHKFLRESFEPTYDDAFEIDPLHSQCQIEGITNEFENTLASAAADRLGAYSKSLRDASADEMREIRDLFSSAGDYFAYKLSPGNHGRHDDHVFSSWFYGVAWDWCLIALWPKRNLLWVGCLTDTD